ncbi:MAG: hypothetical protein C0467_20095 [Planctomycetaceae bacterium]|nr:hypothetical protein [Planctomycetaceae bacterium]
MPDPNETQPAPDRLEKALETQAHLPGKNESATEQSTMNQAGATNVTDVDCLVRTQTQTPEQAAKAAQLSGSPTIPGYELVAELGRGGMGIVYRAKQRGLNREVAIKTILRADVSHTTIARFWAEAEAMAAVKHPYVVNVFELGEHDGRPFMAMEFVAGGSLADYLKATGGLAPRIAAELTEKIARGVAAAHDLGIVHRDLKPANVLLAAGGTPKVADFGLAKFQTNDLTATQAVMGTPAYMAPEQAAGRAKFLGPPADVWSLGVMLYECIAEKRPFYGESAQVLLSQIQSVEPVTLRTQVGGVPRDLDTIAMKCLAKEPEHRYSSASELADDLARFLRGEPIAARPVGSVEGLVRWVRRKPTTAAAYGFSALAVALTLVVAVVATFWREAEGARRDAESARDQLKDEQKLTETARDEALRSRDVADNARRGEELAKREAEQQREILARLNYGRTVQVAYQAWKDHKLASARMLLSTTRPDLRGWEYHYVDRLCHIDHAALAGHVSTGDHKTSVKSALWNPDGTKIVTTDAVSARVWDSATGKQLYELNDNAFEVVSASFSPDGRHLLATCEDGMARLWDAQTGRLVHQLEGHSKGILSGLFSPDGTKVVTAGKDATARLWNVTTGKQLHVLTGHPHAVISATFSPNGSKVLTIGEDDNPRLWDVATGKQLRKFESHGERIISISFSPDGTKAVTTGRDDRSPRVWDAETGELLHELKGHTSGIRSACFSPDSRRVVTAGEDETARVWDAATGKQIHELKGHTHAVVSASFSHDGSKVVTASKHDTARLWDTESGAELLALPGNYIVSFSPEGKRILTRGFDEKTILIYDSRPAKQANTPVPVAPIPRVK